MFNRKLYHRNYMRIWRKLNVKRWREIQQKHQAKMAKNRKAFLNNYKEKQGCIDCGIKDWRVLEFDHIKKTKAFQISHSFCNHAWSAVLAEIKKCAIRCANCHRIRHIEERGE